METETELKAVTLRLNPVVREKLETVLGTCEVDPVVSARVIGPGVVPTRAAVLRAALALGLDAMAREVNQ